MFSHPKLPFPVLQEVIQVFHALHQHPNGRRHRKSTRPFNQVPQSSLLYLFSSSSGSSAPCKLIGCHNKISVSPPSLTNKHKQFKCFILFLCADGNYSAAILQTYFSKDVCQIKSWCSTINCFEPLSKEKFHLEKASNHLHNGRI